MTGFDSVRVAKALDDQWPAPRHLIAHRFVEQTAKRVRAQDADYQGRVGIGEGLRRPLGELGEVEKESRLDLVLFEGLSAGNLTARKGGQQGQRGKATSNQLVCV